MLHNLEFCEVLICASVVHFWNYQKNCSKYSVCFFPKNALLSMGKKCTVKKETTRMRNFHLARKLLEKAECLLPRFRGEHGNPILTGLGEEEYDANEDVNDGDDKGMKLTMMMRFRFMFHVLMVDYM